MLDGREAFKSVAGANTPVALVLVVMRRLTNDELQKQYHVAISRQPEYSFVEFCDMAVQVIAY